MKYLVSLFILFIFLLSHNAFAICSTDGLTVVYVNGILTSKTDAEKNRNDLKKKYEDRTGRTDVNFINGYNPSHLGGGGDLAETTSQILGSSISDYDLNTILLQLYPEITTRKILLLGHSQGTFYTNEIYDYLTKHGEPESSLGVYNVATPASSVARGGAYVTSQSDKVINLTRAFAYQIKGNQPLLANINIPLTSEESANPKGGHSFSRVYLTGATARIVSDVEKALKKLSATEISGSSNIGCFTPPSQSISYKAQGMFLSVADPVANVAIATAQTTYNAAVASAQSAAKIAQNIYTNLNKISTNISSKGFGLISNYTGNPEQSRNDIAATDNSSEQQDNSNVAPGNAMLADSAIQNVAPLPKNQPEDIIAKDAAIQPPQIPESQPTIDEIPVTPTPEFKPTNETPIAPNDSPAPTVPIGGSGPVIVHQQNDSATETQEDASSTEDENSTSTDDTASSTTSEDLQSTSTQRTPPTIESLEIIYTSSTAQFGFSWLPSTDSEGSTSTSKYSIYDITTSTPGVLLFETTSTDISNYSFDYPITETGIDYEFNFVVEDSLDLSNSTTTTIFAEASVPILTSVTVTPATSTIETGVTIQLTANAFDQNGTAFTDATTTWSSSDATIASVDGNGLVTGIAAGTSTITATASSSATVATGTSTIIITAPPVSLPSQLNHDVIIGTGGAAKILISATSTIKKVAFYFGPDGGAYSSSQVLIRIYRDNNDDLGALVSLTSPNDGFGQHDAPREIIFTFDSPVELGPDSYWLFIYHDPSWTSNGVLTYGNSSGDAYFRLISE